MFVYIFILLVSTVNIALGFEIDDDIRVNVHQPRQLPVYSYNHPPLFEEYENSPLSENQKIIIPREVKSMESSASEKQKENVNTPRSLRTSNSQAVQDVSQIPVSVVYEKTPDDNIKPVTSPNVNKIRKRNQRRRNKEANKEIQRQNNLSTQQPSPISEFATKNEEVITLKPIEVSSFKPTTEVSHDVTLFPKRPVEDSKRIEFQKRSRERAPVVKILEEKNFVYAHTGNFHYSYDSADGTKVSSMGELRNINNKANGEAVVGSVSYKDEDGTDFSLSYTADENGYRPVGAHLPTPPPIPPAIARALRYLATKTPDNVTDAPHKD